ncbi:hypothetical protein AAC387_Pa10g0190 [Persea americana]
MGLGHRRTAPPNSKKQEVADSNHRLLHKVGRSRASVIHHQAGHEELRMEEHHYKIWKSCELSSPTMGHNSIPTSSKASTRSTASEMSTPPRRTRKAMARLRSQTKWSLTDSKRDSTELKEGGQKSFQVFYGRTGQLQGVPPRLHRSPLLTAWKQLFHLRSELCDQGLNDLNVARELDFAEERREAVAIRLAAYQQQLARGYN